MRIFRNMPWAVLSVIAVTFSSCEVIGAIFKAGVWTGIIIVILVIALIIYVISRFGRNRNKGS